MVDNYSKYKAGISHLALFCYISKGRKRFLRIIVLLQPIQVHKFLTNDIFNVPNGSCERITLSIGENHMIIRSSFRVHREKTDPSRLGFMQEVVMINWATWLHTSIMSFYMDGLRSFHVHFTYIILPLTGSVITHQKIQ